MNENNITRTIFLCRVLVNYILWRFVKAYSHTLDVRFDDLAQVRCDCPNYIDYRLQHLFHLGNPPSVLWS